jgi:hypothetical protein
MKIDEYHLEGVCEANSTGRQWFAPEGRCEITTGKYSFGGKFLDCWSVDGLDATRRLGLFRDICGEGVVPPNAELIPSTLLPYATALRWLLKQDLAFFTSNTAFEFVRLLVCPAPSECKNFASLSHDDWRAAVFSFRTAVKLFWSIFHACKSPAVCPEAVTDEHWLAFVTALDASAEKKEEKSPGRMSADRASSRAELQRLREHVGYLCKHDDRCYKNKSEECKYLHEAALLAAEEKKAPEEQDPALKALNESGRPFLVAPEGSIKHSITAEQLEAFRAQYAVIRAEKEAKAVALAEVARQEAEKAAAIEAELLRKAEEEREAHIAAVRERDAKAAADRELKEREFEEKKLKKAAEKKAEKEKKHKEKHADLDALLEGISISFSDSFAQYF